MNDNEVKKLYTALLGKGYSTNDLGDEDTFRTKMSDKASRKQLYDWVSSKGNFRLGDYDTYENRLTSSTGKPEQRTEEPKPVTTSTEVGSEASVENPLSEQDKKRFSAGINQMMYGAKQSMDETNEQLSNLSEYREKEPLGGTTANGSMQFNPESGKMENTYITPLGNRYASKELADMESFRYRQAADMSVNGQLRRANLKLAELKEKKAKSVKRVHEEAVADYEKNKAPLASLLFADTYSARQMSDKENSALDVAIRQTEELIKDLEEQKDREQGEDVGFWRGFGRVAGDSRTWDFGIGDMRDAMTMMNADGLKGENSTDGEREAYNEMMGAIHNKEQAEQMYGDNADFWNRAGIMTGHMPSFMLDFAITGGGFEGINLLAKGGAKTAAKVVGKEVAEDMAAQGFKNYVKNNGVKGFGQYATNWTIKALGTTADDLLLRAPLMTNTSQLGKTTADIIDRKLGDVVVNEDGSYDFSNDKTWGSAIWQGEANAIIENYSEMFGAHLDPVVTFKNMGKLADVIGAKRIGAILAKADEGALNGIMGQTQQLFNKMGVSDYFGEVTEEYYGQMWRTMLDLDDAYQQNPDGTRTNLLATGRFHGDIWGGMALSMGLMGAAKHTISGAHYVSMKHGINKADAHATELLGKEIWEPMKATLDATTNDDMGAMAEAIVNDKNFTDKERDAVLTYMERSMMMRGFNLRTLAQKRGIVQDPDKQALDESYIDGYNLESSEEMNDAKNMYDYQRQKTLAIIDEDFLADIENDPAGHLDYIRNSENWSDEERGVLIDYLNAKQVYDGMIQRVRDDIDGRIDQSNAMIDARTNHRTGMIQPATMKVDDRRVYVINGNLVQYADGSGIDNNASDGSIIVRDAETGALEQVAPDAILNIDEALNPSDEKQTAADVIRQQFAQEAADKIDGVVTFNPGDTYTIVGDDAQIQVQIVANESGIVDNGDGTVNVSDGVNVFPIAKETIQQQVEAAQLARVAQFEQQRAEENAARKQAIEEENRPQYALNDLVSLRDENGNIVRGHITTDVDADGNYEIFTESPINGKRVNLFTRDELDAMLTEHNGVSIEPQVTSKLRANYEQSTSESANGSANEMQTALQRIPKDEQGNPLYEQADNETAWDAIVEQTEGDEVMAQTVADGMVADKEAALKKLEKSKPKGGISIADKIKAEKEHKAAIDAAKQELDVWKKIAGTANRRKSEAEEERRRIAAEETARIKAEEERLRAEREEAERIKREALNGVPDMVDDTPQDARARGYRRVNGHKVDRQEPVQALQGKEVSVRFSNDAMANGRVAVIDASQLQPSHIQGVRNPLHFIDEAQPKERNDEASVLSARKIAENMRPEEITSSVTAYTGAPTVNTRGEAIQGNSRSDALRLMWESHKDQAAQYKQYLKDHAEEFGLRTEDIDAMESPVLVNMLDVDDAQAITLGQYVAQDTESGGTERIKPKNALQKMGSDMRSFANLLLKSSDEETSFAGLVDNNGVDVLKWMSQKGCITPTQYKSAFDSKGHLTAEAKNDLRGIMYQSIFKGGSTRLKEMFNALPSKAQKAILATAFRDYDSPNAERMIEEIQNSIRAYYALSQDKSFVEAKDYKEARIAVEAWKRQYQIDDVTGESYLPAESFSNFALLLATMYRGENQSIIQGTFSKLYDLIQGTQETTLFEQPDNTPRTLAQAINETLNITYDGQQRSNVLAGNSSASQGGQQGSTGDASTGKRVEDGSRTADSTGGTESGSEQSEVTSIEHPTEIGENSWGKVFQWVRGKVIEAANFLKKAQKGYLKGVFYRKELGEIDLFWGNEKSGLAHIIDKHVIKHSDFTSVENAVSVIDDVISTGEIIEQPNGRIAFVKEGNRVVIERTLEGNWVVTAFDETRKPKEKKRSEEDATRLHQDIFGKENGELVSPNSASVGKDTTKSQNNNELGENVVTAERISVQEDDWTEEGKYGDTYKRTIIIDGVHHVTQVDEADKSGNYTGSYFMLDGKRFAGIPEVVEHIDNNGAVEKAQQVLDNIENARKEVDTNPTDAQKEAGNYKKGHVKIDGFDITIENPKGGVRSGTDKNGKKWSITMNNDYGYIRGTEAVDGDHIDVFLSSFPTQGSVFVVDQANEDGTFDESKVMYGFSSLEEARAAYLSNYEKGWETRIMAITEVSKDEFKKWIDSSHRKTKAFSEYKTIKKADERDLKQQLSKFKVGDVVRDFYENKLYRIKKHSTNGVSVIARLDEEGNEVSTTTINAHNNARYSLAEAPVKSETPTVSQESDQVNDQDNGKDSNAPYTIEPAQYTTKKGKVLDMQLVKFTEELRKGVAKNAYSYAKSLKGWWDREKGGFMMRSEEDAKQLAEYVADAQEQEPVSMSDIKAVNDGDVSFTEPQQPKAEKGSDNAHTPVWQYSVSVDKESGRTTLRREDVSGLGAIIPIVDARFTVSAESPEEMLDILRNPLNGMQEILDAVGVTLENKIKTRAMDKKVKKTSVKRPQEGDIYKNNMAGGDAVALIRGVGREEYVVAFASDLEDAQGGLFMGDKIVDYEEMDKWLADGSLTKIERKKEYHGGERVFSLKHNTNKDILAAHHKGDKVEYVFTDGTTANSDEVHSALPLAEPKNEPKDEPKNEANPSVNRLVTDERYKELRERMRKKLGGQMNIGIDPEILAIGTEMAVYHLEKGARKFAEYAKAMIADLGDAIRPYLKAFYNGARELPEVMENGLSDDMTPYDEVQTFDVANFDKPSVDAFATAETVTKETEIAGEVEIAQERIKKTRPAQKKSEKKSVSSQKQTGGLFDDLFAESNKADAELHRKFAMTVKADMLAALDDGTKPYRSILDLRKRASELGMKVDNEGRTDILLQELAEDGLVRAAREVVERKGRNSRESYDLICKLYEMQPTIAARSSNRIKMQQYSTPLPMAWIANRFAMENNADGRVLEPTAGNGMLVFTVPVNQVHANELDETRLDNLRDQGFAEVTQQDATEPFEGGMLYDAVIANPPFGKREAVEYDGKMIPGLDPQITLNALSSMKDNGRAAIIIGGNMEYSSNGAIKSMKPFFTYLYDHYNVKGVIDMSGGLYAKQGTTFPTRMILIDGRRSEEERAQTAVYPPVESKAIRKAESFEDLYEIINEVLNSKEKTNGTEILRSRQGQLVSVDNKPSGNTDGTGHREQPRKNDETGKRGSRPEGNQNRGEQVLSREHRANNADGEARTEASSDNTGRSGSVSGLSVQRLGTDRVSSDGVGLNSAQTVHKKRTLTDEKSAYRPHNSAFSLNSVAPAAMVEAMDRVLTQIEEQHGSIDEFVRTELGYDTIEEAHQALAAEQMDSVAMAIYQMKQGQALIIGDQTGVGKGRQMAALIRWAVQRGEKPVFITQKADLFSDIYRDLVDVGSGDLVPFIFNSDGAMVDNKGNTVHKPLSSSEMAKVFASGTLPDKYDFAVLTYSQVNTGDAISQKEMAEAAKNTGERAKKGKNVKNGKPTPKATFLRAIAEDNYLFLDESHTAAGSSNTGAYLQSILRSAKAATFASATFAKRPDTMPLYAIRTAMSQAKVEPNKMIGIIEKGGVTLQEIMSRELTNAGQMVRRERDMSDVVTDWKTITDPETVRRSRENYDRTIAAFNAIIKFQEDYVKPMIETLDMELAVMAESAGVKRGTDKMGVENVPFASKTYNYTKQLMLALKVDAIADEVEAEIKAGRHPVIALESTMESSIKDYAAGETIDEPTFSASLLRGLDTVMQYTVKDENGRERHERYSPQALGPVGEKAYYDLQNFIRESTSDIFISPLDAIIERLHEKGYKVGELTGRNMYVERKDDGRVVVKRRTDKDKKRMQRDFNSGLLDVLILNKSASTGISLHASEKFSDQRQRSMIIAQPLSDINDYMQMIGRIDRTGQVHRGYYINLGLPVPAENRFLMMLSTKLKSLNANTTTSQDSESNDVEAPDLLNKYGSQVVVEYLRDNLEVYEKMGTPLKKGGMGGGRLQASELEDYKAQEDDARKVTGYVALLTTKEQEEFYDDVVRRYNELIKYLNDTGSNDLKITVMPLRAKTIEKRVSSEGIDPNGNNPFARNSYVEKVEMDVLRKPMKADEIRKVIEQINKGDATAYMKRVMDTVSMEDEARIAAENERYERAKERAVEDIAKQTEKINGQKKRSDEEKRVAIENFKAETNEKVEAKHKDNMARIYANRDQMMHRLTMFESGKSYLVPENLYSLVFDFATPAIFCGYKTKESKITASTTLAVFATLDGRRRIEIKLSQIDALQSIERMTEDNWDAARSTTLDNWDSQIPSETRKTGFIMTGNILQAIADTQDERGGSPGQLISYTDMDGNIHDGILMPDKWNTSMLKTSGAPLSSRLQQIKDYAPVKSHDGKVELTGSSWAKTYYLTVPKTKKDGAVYFENKTLLRAAGGNFYPYRGQLRADIPAAQIDEVVKVLTQLGVKVKEENNDDTLYRKGVGTYSNDEVSMSNDPVGKMLGRSSRSASERKEFAVRERERMVQRVKDLANKLGLDNVEIVTDASSLDGNKQRAKGFYSKSTGKITIVIPNHSSVFDAEQTLLHEAVAHYGLRQLFGEHFDTFLDNVFNHADESIRRRIVDMAAKNGWDFRKATEEYLATLAENTEFENVNAGWWGKIKQLFLQMLHSIGFENFGGVTLTDNELRYILWRSYENLAEPGRYRSILGEAADVAKQYELGVGNYAQAEESVRIVAEGDSYSPESVIHYFEEVVSNHPGIYAVRTEEDIDTLPTDQITKKTLKQKLKNPREEAVQIKEDNMMVLFVEHIDKKELRNVIPHELAHFASRNIRLDEFYKMSALAYLQSKFPKDYEHIIGTYEKVKWSEEAVAYLFEEKAKELGFERILNGKFDSHTDIGYIFYQITNYLNHGKNRNNPIRYGERPSESVHSGGSGKTESKDMLGNVRGGTRKGTEGSLSSNDRRGTGGELGTSSSSAVGYRPESRSQAEEVDDDVLYRSGDPEIHERRLARDRYEKRVKSGMFQSQEALQDSMLGLKEAMLSILGDGKDIEDVDGFENAYLGENRLSSVNKAEADAFAQTLFKPMLDEVAKLAGNESARELLTNYMMAKHGLERNLLMAENAAKDAVAAGDARPFADILSEYREKDYAGLTALTGKDNVADAEAEARWMVHDYELLNDTTELWEKVNAVSKAILQKSYECGLMSKATFDKVSDMYEYYIPLRGFDEKTSAEAYAYLSHKQSAFNAPIKKAEGRKSKADDPFANLQSMAESAIMQGNRNKLVKQRFLNFALNHPSDLVSVSDIWLEYDAIADEWKPVFPDNIDSTDTPDEVEQKMQDFEAKMQGLAQQYPDQYKHGKDAIGIPYRVVESRDMKQHQVIVKRGGRDYVITINGNPRAAQALNGQTNPDNDMSDAIGMMLRIGEKINRQLSAFYTTRNPDFIISNFMRDMLYTNSMAWIKESPNYALRFHRNYLMVNPILMKRLFAKYRKGTLDMSDKTEAMFHQFMMNGGETGYANIRDIEQHKNDIRKELKRANGKLGIGRAMSLLAEKFDELNRAVENCARFAAFVTSREMGRSIDKSIYDAKEISVNFNKKGSGAKFLNTTGQTRSGNVSAFTSGLGRSSYVFWNAAIQGTTNFGRQMKRHPAKALTGIAAMFLLGAIVAYLGGDDDEDDKNAYYNLPEYVRRSNILFRTGDSWISIPLPIEYRAFYGMGELMTSIFSGKEHLKGAEIAEAIAGQATQILPIDFLEGGGGLNAFVPSAAKPLWEAYVAEKSWTGMPLYKDTPYNKDMPEWTKAFKSANKYIVNLASVLNEATGGDPYTKGFVDINPSKVEYMLNGYFGGVSGTIDKLAKMGETWFGDREYDPRSFLLWNRLIKAGDESTEYRAVNNEYFRLKEEHDRLKTRLKHYEEDTDNGIFDFAEKIDFLYNSPEYERYEIFEDYQSYIQDLYEELKETVDDEERKDIEDELNAVKKEMIQEMNLTRKRK